jgi:hypothetical protein
LAVLDRALVEVSGQRLDVDDTRTNSNGTDLVSESDRVKGYCCQRGWVTRLLHMLHYQPLDSEVVLRELFILMESLGSFSLSSKELKQLLRFLYGQTTPDFEDSGATSDDSPEGKQLLQELYPPVQVHTRIPALHG